MKCILSISRPHLIIGREYANVKVTPYMSGTIRSSIAIKRTEHIFFNNLKLLCFSNFLKSLRWVIITTSKSALSDNEGIFPGARNEGNEREQN